jgi:hypothetical protein
MQAVIKRVVGWDAKTEPQKQDARRRLALWRYRARMWLATLVSPLPLPLPWLLTATGTDKHQPDRHLYGHVYDRYFRRFRHRRTRLLEIGIGGYGHALGGQSLVAWRAYFPRGTVVACDLHPRPGMASGRTRVRQMDQSSPADLRRLAAEEGPFDIVIDDGSHMSSHQILTFRELFGAVRDGGVYVVEDTMTSYWTFSGWDGAGIGAAALTDTCMGWFTALAHYVNHAEFETTEGADPTMLALAPAIGHILFAKGLIVIEKNLGPKGAAAVGRLKGAA